MTYIFISVFCLTESNFVLWSLQKPSTFFQEKERFIAIKLSFQCRAILLQTRYHSKELGKDNVDFAIFM